MGVVNVSKKLVTEEASGIVNGDNKIFMSSRPFITINVFWDGQMLTPGIDNDYIILTDTTIQLTEAPRVFHSEGYTERITLVYSPK